MCSVYSDSEVNVSDSEVNVSDSAILRIRLTAQAQVNRDRINTAYSRSLPRLRNFPVVLTCACVRVCLLCCVYVCACVFVVLCVRACVLCVQKQNT